MIYIAGGLVAIIGLLILALALVSNAKGRLEEREAIEKSSIEKEREVHDAVDRAPTVRVSDDWLQHGGSPSPSEPGSGKTTP